MNINDIYRKKGCGRQFCPVCSEELIHRDNRKYYESSSALGQIVHRDLGRNFGCADIDLVTEKTFPGHISLLRIIEQKQPQHNFGQSQRTILSLLARCIDHCVRCKDARDVRIHPRSGVFLMKGNISGNKTSRIEFDGPQILERLGEAETIVINNIGDLGRFITGDFR